MIDIALEHLAQQLNQFLRLASASGEDLVVVSNLVDADGSGAAEVKNKIALVLAGVQREAAAVRGDVRSGPWLTGGAISLNLSVLVAANFYGQNYKDALRLLSSVVGYFHSNPVFDRVNSPGLDVGIDRLTVEVENLTIHEMSNLWGMLGSKYMPSILYRVRMVSINSDAVRARTPIVGDPQLSAAAASAVK